MSPRVLVYTDSAGIGGAEISLKHLVAHVDPAFEMAIAGVSQPVIEFVGQGRPQATQICLPASGMSTFLAHRTAFQRWRPDLIHANLCTPWAGATGLAAALSLPRVRVIRVEQLPLRTTDLLTWLRTRLICLRCDACVAVGEACARRLEDFYALGRHSVYAIPNGVPPVAPGQPHPPPPEQDTLRVGSIGRLDPMKGHDVLLRALAQVDGLHLEILGEGDYRPQLERLAADLGIAHRVKLPGWVDHPAAQLSRFDMVVQPSRSEGFPLTVVEAMLASRPIIATRVGSVAEAILDGETGLLIDKDQVGQLAAALYRLKTEPELRDRIAKAARTYALGQFTAAHMAQRYEHLWRHVLAQPQRPRLWVPRPKD